MACSFHISKAVSCSMAGFNHCFLTCAQVSQEAGKVVWYSHFFKNFSQFAFIHTKAFNIANEGEIDVFLDLSCFLHDPVNVGNLISDSFAFSKSNLYIWKFSVHILLKCSLKDFEHYLDNMWKEHSCIVVWTFFGTAFLWDLNENWSISVLVSLLSFPNLIVYWVQHFNRIIF